MVGGLSAALLSACSPPAGVDGEVTDDWATVSDPKAFTPSAGVCHETDYTETGPLASYDPVDCGAAHRTETLHVGTFTGTAASGASPPAAGSPPLRTAYAECDKQARDYLGSDFRYGRLWLGVVVPSSEGWRGGARWFRCEAVEKADHENFGETVNRTGSLKGALRSTSPLNLTCYQVKAKDSGIIESRTPAPCSSSHNSEFAGVFTASATSYPAKSADWDRLHDSCRKVIAKYVGLPDDGDLKYRTGTVVVPGAQDDWVVGNRGVRCYLYLSDKTFTRSLKGAGTKGLPIRYG
ncbi:MAG TPA: septum formation family protein [Pilimelia sp.]|nr:septum formation family protein [Pilimelia sp.]